MDAMDSTDRRIVNALQGGFPVSEYPYRDAAAELGLAEDELIRRIEALLDKGVLSRFGPMFDAERMGGGVTLAAMRVPEAAFDLVAEAVNAHAEVAHNYARDDDLNMWFVVAAETPARVKDVIAAIEAETGLPVLDLPKIEEFFVGLRLDA